MSLYEESPQALFETDVQKLTLPQAEDYLRAVRAALADLDAREPRTKHGDAYEEWADEHEVLEDMLDEVLDRLEDLGQ